MGGKLSALKYVLNNKKAVRVMLIALSLSFMTMYVIYFLFMVTAESVKNLFMEQPKKIVFFELSYETMGIDSQSFSSKEELNAKVANKRNELIQDLKNSEGITEVYYSQVLSSSFIGIVGSVYFYFPLLEPDEIPTYLNHMQATLIEGRMPQNDGEILVDKRILDNNRLKLGGNFRETIFGNVFKVVGVVESDICVCVGTPHGFTNNGWRYIVLCNPDSADVKNTLQKFDITLTENDSIRDLESMEESYEHSLKYTLDSVVLGIMLVIIVFLAIAIIVSYVSFMRNRVAEYCLYVSIGYGRKDIYGMIMRELFIIFGGSVVIGAFFSMIAMFLFGKFLITPLGLIYKYFYPMHLVKIFVAFVAIIGVLQIPILITINSVKTIDRIED